MRYRALATDYDGTLASDGRVDPATVEALKRLRASGRRLLLVTGRRREDVADVFPGVGLFDQVVAENGGLLYCPATRRQRRQGPRPPKQFIDALRRRGVERLSVGQVVVGAWRPDEDKVFDAIRHLGSELQVIFNKDALMVLPPGVNKATGLRLALQALALSPREVIGIGDAENDLDFLRVCRCSVAVANALPAVREQVDRVTAGARGQGVIELIEWLIEHDGDPCRPYAAPGNRHETVAERARTGQPTKE